MKSLKQCVSTGNLNTIENEEFASKLGSKLSLLKRSKDSFKVIQDNDKQDPRLQGRAPGLRGGEVTGWLMTGTRQ